MKLYFVVTDTNESTTIAALDTIELMIGTTYHKLEKIAGLCKDGDGIVMAKLTTTTFGVWVSIDKTVQKVRFTNAAAATVEPSPDFLSDGGVEAFGDIVDTTINEFIPGKIYLIPFSAGPVTRIMPQQMLIAIEGLVDAVFTPTHYVYRCSQRHNVRTGTGFTGCIVDANIAGAAQIAANAAKGETVEAATFVQKALG